MGLGEILRRPCVPIRMEVAGSFLFARAVEIALAVESLGMEFVEVKHIPGKSNESADALSRLSEGAALPQMSDHVPRLPALDRETAFKVWPWHMWIAFARKENHDFVTVCLKKKKQGVSIVPRRLATGTTV